MGSASDDATARERPAKVDPLDATRLPGTPAVTEPPDDVTVPASSPGAVPSRIGRFEVQRKLGEGGMGVVLLAVDPTLQRNVALKLLHDGAGADDQSRRRLVREAQAVAKVVDEHVIVVHEVGTHDHHVFVAMEYVAGGTLGTWQRGRPWREVLAAYLRAGNGLRAAHAAGLVHRDFKPDNVLVGDDGRLRVTDFGLVASVDAPPETALAMPRAGSELATSLTRTGTVMGTPRFMAPEQHMAEPLDARADQFSFCAALYEALYGAPPFPGNMIAVIAARVCAGEVEPIPADTSVPASIGAAIMRGLSRDRDARFPSMTELLDALEPPAPTPVVSGSPAAPDAPRRRRRWLPVVAIAAVVVAGAIVALLLVRGGSGADHRRAKELAAEGMVHVGNSDAVAAVKSFEASLAHEEDWMVRYQLGVAYAMLGRSDEALRSLDLALASPDSDPAALPNMRLLRASVAQGANPAPPKSSDGPRPWAVGISKADQDRALALFQRGNDALKKSEFRNASVAFDEALRVWKHPAIHYNQALAKMNLDLPREALDHLDAALIYPDALEHAKVEKSRHIRELLIAQLRAKDAGSAR